MERLDLTGRNDIPYRAGRLAAAPFDGKGSGAVLEVLDDPGLRAALVRDMDSPSSRERLEAFMEGFRSGLTNL